MQKYPNIIEKISIIFFKNPSGLYSTSELASIFGMDKKTEKYLDQTLAVWSSSLCTFFKYGRMFKSKCHHKWFWISPQHPLAREHFPNIDQPNGYYVDYNYCARCKRLIKD